MATRQLSQQIGKQITPQEAAQFGVPQRVLSQMLAEATLDDTARTMGLSISPDTVGRLIRSDRNLQGPNGEFNRTYFAQIAQAQGLKEDDLVLLLRADYIRNQLDQGLAGNVTVPETIIKAVGEYRDDERAINYVVLTAPPATAIADPSDSDLKTYFDAHKSAYRAPEFRAISYFVISPEEIAKAAGRQRRRRAGALQPGEEPLRDARHPQGRADRFQDPGRSRGGGQGARGWQDLSTSLSPSAISRIPTSIWVR